MKESTKTRTLSISLALFFIPIFIGVFGIPFIIWAIIGFPDSQGSHGLWLPFMIGAYFGLPGGIIIGLGGLFGYSILRNIKRKMTEETQNGKGA
jgi:hypothetical protein